MSALDVDNAVRIAVAQRLKISADALTRDTDLDDLGLNDDETALGVIVAVEELLDVRFPDDFLDGVDTFGQLATAIRVAVRN